MAKVSGCDPAANRVCPRREDRQGATGKAFADRASPAWRQTIADASLSSPPPDGHYQLYVCDYRFSSASGKGGGASWMLVCLVSETLALPRLHIEGLPDAPGWARSLHYALANAMEIPGAVRVITGRSEIDSRYQIYGFDGDAARHVPPGLLPILRDAPGNIGVDMGGDVLILSSVEMMADRMRQELDPQKIQGLIHRAVVMFGAITPQGLKSMLHV